MTNISKGLINLADIKARYFSLLEEREREIRQTKAEMTGQEPGRGQRAALAGAEVLHKLAGSSAMLGFSDIGDAARITEEQLLSWAQQRGGSKAEAMAALSAFLDVIENARYGR